MYDITSNSNQLEAIGAHPRKRYRSQMENNNSCKICGLGPVSPEDLGPLISVGNVYCHANCMYFSSGLTQEEDIDNPWLGFNDRDVKRLVKEAHKKKCLYCGLGGAHVSCARKGCKRRYHFVCGLEHHVTYQFHDSFHSYCHRHRGHYKKLNLPSNGYEAVNERCVYCFENITESTNKFLYFRSHCCNATYMHIKCAKMAAMNAGAFTKCPGCNSEKSFVAQLLTIGVNVPHCDATWEDSEQFQDLYEPRRTCIALKCICPGPATETDTHNKRSLLKKQLQQLEIKDGGRTRNDRDGYWKLLLCRLCGGSEIHKGCLDGVRSYQKSYTCRTCTDVEIDLQLKKRKKKRLRSRKKLVDWMTLPQSSRVLRNRNC